MSKKEDVSVLRPTIQLGGEGVSGILNAMKVGTAEIHDQLLHQCNVILECKVCQNLFRGLANFLAHKRVYCQQQHNESRLLFVNAKEEEETIIVQPKPPPEKKEKEKPEWDDYVSSDEEAPPQKKESGMSVFEQMKKGIFRGNSASYEFYTKAVERQNRKSQKRKQTTVTLENIPSTSNAVKQKVDKEGEDCMIEAKGRGRPKKRKRLEDEEEETKVVKIRKEGEEEEEEVLVVEPKAATGPLGMNLRQRGANGSNSMLEQLKRRSDCDVKSLECLTCKQSYATVKTLHFHMTSLHEAGGLRTFYPCPFCSAVYSQVWSATRHVAKVHDQNQQHKRALTAQIRKNAFQKSVTELRSGSTEKKPPTSNTSPNGGEFGLDFVMYRCKGCKKLFEKKDSHDRHVRMCAQAKATSSNTITSSEVLKKETDESNNNGSSTSSSPVSSTLSQMVNNSEISAEEMNSILEIIDETTHQCLKCYRMFGTISNLHRHAIRHLGWRRFKCQFCRFLSYNKSECRRHLRVVHQKAVAKTGSSASNMHVDSFIDKIEAADVEASPVKNKLPRVEMTTMGRGSPRKTRGAARAATAAPDTLLVTRSGTYNKPTFKQLTKGRSKNGDDESDSDTSNTSANSSKPEAQEEEEEEDDIKEDEDDIMQVKQDVTSSRNRRKGQTPQRSGGAESPRAQGVNTPATARPASHILSQSPAKASTVSTITSVPMKTIQTASPGKSPTVNILSKSVPKFSISGGVTTVLLPVFTQCVQVQSGGQGASKWIRPMSTPPPPPVSQTQPHIRVLGPNFQLPGSSGSAHVRTVAVSTLPTSVSHTVTGSNAQTTRLSSSTSTISSSVLSVMTISGGTSVTSSLPTSVVAGNRATGMPILCPMQPISVASVDSTTLITNPDVVTVSLDSSCQLSPAMPSLAPIATQAVVTESMPLNERRVVPQRSLTPQPIKAVAELDLKQRSFTPSPPVIAQLGGAQMSMENLVVESSNEQDLQHVTLLPKVDSGSSISLVADVTAGEDALSSNGHVTGEELITMSGSTDNSCSSFQQANPVGDNGNYILPVPPASECQILLDNNKDEPGVSEDAYVSVSTTATLGAESAEVVTMDTTEGVELLQMIDSNAATDPMQYINQ